MRYQNINEIDLDLIRVKKLLSLLDNPQNNIKNIIHIAGTNGKGSVIAFLRAFLENSGFSVNIYTSPHLIKFNERIRIKKKLISDTKLAYYNNLCKEIIENNLELKKITFFENSTAMAIKAFAEHPADFNIVETGLGGRLDATNVFNQEKTAIITPISYDHQDFLGDDIEQIAQEKLGIITKNTKNLFIAKQIYDFKDLILAKNCQNVHFFENFYQEIILPDNFGLLGEHQKENFILAAQVFNVLTGCNYPRTFKKTLFWPSRLQKIDGFFDGDKKNVWQVYLDGGHNILAAEILSKFINDNHIDYVLIGILKRKNYKNFIKIIAEKTKARIYFSEFKNKELLKIKELDKELTKILKKSFSSITKAKQYFIKKEFTGKLLICGSLFLAEEILNKEKCY